MSQVKEAENSGGAALLSPVSPEQGLALKRCPFHEPESNLSEVVGEWHSNQRIAYWAVFCEACGARGPEEATKEEAIKCWNHRPTGNFYENGVRVDFMQVLEREELAIGKLVDEFVRGPSDQAAGTASGHQSSPSE